MQDTSCIKGFGVLQISSIATSYSNFIYFMIYIASLNALAYHMFYNPSELTLDPTKPSFFPKYF